MALRGRKIEVRRRGGAAAACQLFECSTGPDGPHMVFFDPGVPLKPGER